ncbi:MAG: hypothetical protein F6K31_15220 [Symploca sp. SIO2G7]|nr:hypothetical protein [Symploca sp. SIO2G7]
MRSITRAIAYGISFGCSRTLMAPTLFLGCAIANPQGCHAVFRLCDRFPALEPLPIRGERSHFWD